MSVIQTLIGNVRGPQGIQGIQGVQGEPGQDGTNGVDGQDGTAATIAVGTVTTAAYGSSAEVNNVGTPTAAVFDFVIPQGAPGEDVTDMSGLTLDNITASSASYPEFAVGETGATVFGKIKKFLSDLKNNYVSKSMMTTSTNISTTGQNVADAVAIKSLNESLTNLEAKSLYGTFRASNVSPSVTFELHTSHHAFCAVAAGFFVIFRAGNAIYTSDMPSGFSASLSGENVTITRSTSTAFTADILIL